MSNWTLNLFSTNRRIRGEAKKCRKVYGIEHRDQWCTACRWKKACQRFLDWILLEIDGNRTLSLQRPTREELIWNCGWRKPKKHLCDLKLFLLFITITCFVFLLKTMLVLEKLKSEKDSLCPTTPAVFLHLIISRTDEVWPSLHAVNSHILNVYVNCLMWFKYCCH